VRDLVEFIARGIVDEPDRVRVHEPARRTLELEVAPDDLGRVIGRRGRTANAMRTVVNASVGGRGINLEIAESDSD
jgi:predicted RNA-binding protein YlqC (UPF0109 family)